MAFPRSIAEALLLLMAPLCRLLPMLTVLVSILCTLVITCTNVLLLPQFLYLACARTSLLEDPLPLALLFLTLDPKQSLQLLMSMKLLDGVSLRGPLMSIAAKALVAYMGRLALSTRAVQLNLKNLLNAPLRLMRNHRLPSAPHALLPLLLMMKILLFLNLISSEEFQAIILSVPFRTGLMPSLGWLAQSFRLLTIFEGTPNFPSLESQRCLLESAMLII